MSVDLSANVPMLEQRIRQLEVKTDRIIESTISRELHSSEYKSLEKRIDAVESLLKTIILLTLSNLFAISGFLVWQFIGTN